MSGNQGNLKDQVELLRELNNSKKDRNTMILGILVVNVGGILVLYMVNKNTELRITAHYEPHPMEIEEGYY